MIWNHRYSCWISLDRFTDAMDSLKPSSTKDWNKSKRCLMMLDLMMWRICCSYQDQQALVKCSFKILKRIHQFVSLWVVEISLAGNGMQHCVKWMAQGADLTIRFIMGSFVDQVQSKIHCPILIVKQAFQLSHLSLFHTHHPHLCNQLSKKEYNASLFGFECYDLQKSG